MAFILKILLFLNMMLKSMFVFVPVLLGFSWFQRKMFHRSKSLGFFLMVTVTAIGWRLVYTLLNDSLRVATRYIATLNIFLIVLAVPGIYAFIKFVHYIVSLRFDKLKEKHLWVIGLSAVVLVSLIKELRPETPKVFLRDTGVVIKQISDKAGTANFILFENLGEGERLTYYTPWLKNKIRILSNIKAEGKPFVNLVTYNVEQFQGKWDKVFILTRSKLPEALQENWKMYALKRLKIKKTPFKLVKKYPYRKLYYLLFEFDLSCLKKQTL